MENQEQIQPEVTETSMGESAAPAVEPDVTSASDTAGTPAETATEQAGAEGNGDAQTPDAETAEAPEVPSSEGGASAADAGDEV